MKSRVAMNVLMLPGIAVISCSGNRKVIPGSPDSKNIIAIKRNYKCISGESETG